MPDPTALPKHVQISEMLIRDIQAGRLVAGERLPPEREMAAQLGIAVGTLRKALATLTEQGLLQRIQGSGNYIRDTGKPTGIYAFFRLETPEGGGLPTARVISVERMDKPAHLPPFGADSRAHRIRRVRSLNGAPVALEEIWLDGAWAEELSASELSESLYWFYAHRLGLRIMRAEDRIGVGKMPEWGDVPELAAGRISGLVERKSLDQEGRVAEVSFTWFDPERARYVSRLR
ncbi:GntR family transcriptional regulator [Meinhardsimonia xiamenensis]|uniref:GntR family transcriptional regulator n=1 Tax=Meinhardsimonia xiamenensis TaxID=990712 RepID=A0A1G9GPK8_9RHOB|nr:GntR family transcriptional regulator [Meinhardsimonia xiamenensis]PRX30517.1 GntR family transcriptional regulator [Meinhardsimonia xiamenensis]SDL02552.1 GntR family transcriptional regulator [Meinhardsimonia xiamenensis]